jgi:hypothetical protein
MKLPCGHDSERIPANVAPNTKEGGCAVCYHYLRSPAYKAHYESDKCNPPAEKRAPCVHLGEATGERRECASCMGNVRIKLKSCAVFGQCTEIKKVGDDVACCLSCHRYIGKPEIQSTLASLPSEG